MSGAVVLGARNLGGAIATHLHEAGWSVAAVARSDESLAAVRERGITGLNADAPTRTRSPRRSRRPARSTCSSTPCPPRARPAARGAAARSRTPTPKAYEAWTGAVSRQASRSCPSAPRRCAAGGGGTLVQVTGGSARRAMPGRGLWAAGAAATRALTHAAAQELRTEGIHVALLIVDATIASPKTAERTRDVPADALADQAEIARAVAYLAGQQPTAYTHGLVVTPCGRPLAAVVATAAPVSRRGVLAAYSGIMLATLLAALDQTIVATALPRIVTDLRGFSDLSWVVTAYLVASTVTVPLYGKLSDIYGRRRLFVVAISIFLVGSPLCGAGAERWASSSRFRALQGLGAGGLCRSPRRRSPTSSRRASAAATRATSARCGRSRRSPGRCSAAR